CRRRSRPSGTPEMPEITMPRLSDSMEEGTILKWLVSEGDEVKRGQAIAEIETDKANMTYEVDTDGTVSELVAKEGDTLPVGEVIARVGEGNGAGRSSLDAGREQDEPEQKDEEPDQEEPREEPDEPEPEPDERRATSDQRPASSNGGERV